MNYILRRTGSDLLRLLMRYNYNYKPAFRRQAPPLQTATRHYHVHPQRLEISRSTAPSRALALTRQWPALRRLLVPLARTWLPHCHYHALPRRPELIHFTRGRGGLPWFLDWRKVAARVLLPGAAAIAAYYCTLETVPYTNRTHLIFLPPRVERWLGELLFDDTKEEEATKILPPEHDETVRLRRLTSEIVGAAERTLVPVQRDEQLLDDRWMTRRYRSQVKARVAPPMTKHLDGLDWEVIVVKDDNNVNAMCLPGGKIMVYTGFLNHFKTDAEIATVIGHEVGHVIARHTAEAASKSLLSMFMRIGVRQFFDSPSLVKCVSTLLLDLPFSRRREMEADSIGMLLLAAAGFDPHIAAEVQEKLGKIGGNSELQNYLSTHPSSNKRAKCLLQDKIMEEALELYREASATKGEKVSSWSLGPKF